MGRCGHIICNCFDFSIVYDFSGEFFFRINMLGKTCLKHLATALFLCFFQKQVVEIASCFFFSLAFSEKRVLVDQSFRQIFGTCPGKLLALDAKEPKGSHRPRLWLFGVFWFPARRIFVGSLFEAHMSPPRGTFESMIYIYIYKCIYLYCRPLRGAYEFSSRHMSPRRSTFESIIYT